MATGEPRAACALLAPCRHLRLTCAPPAPPPCTHAFFCRRPAAAVSKRHPRVPLRHPHIPLPDALPREPCKWYSLVLACPPACSGCPAGLPRAYRGPAAPPSDPLAVRPSDTELHLQIAAGAQRAGARLGCGAAGCAAGDPGTFMWKQRGCMVGVGHALLFVAVGTPVCLGRLAAGELEPLVTVDVPLGDKTHCRLAIPLSCHAGGACGRVVEPGGHAVLPGGVHTAGHAAGELLGVFDQCGFGCISPAHERRCQQQGCRSIPPQKSGLPYC